jgi:hypothetical protein
VAGDGGGLPLSVIVSAANANDATTLAAVLDDIPPIRMPSGGDAGDPPRSMPTRPRPSALPS